MTGFAGHSYMSKALSVKVPKVELTLLKDKKVSGTNQTFSILGALLMVYARD